MLRVVTFYISASSEFHKLLKDAVLWNKSVNVNSQFVLDQRCFFLYKKMWFWQKPNIGLR